MASSLQLNVSRFSNHQSHYSKHVSKHSPKSAAIRCSATPPSKRYTITLLPGDGIGPEVISVAKNVLEIVGSIENIPTQSLHLNRHPVIIRCECFEIFHVKYWRHTLISIKCILLPLIHRLFEFHKPLVAKPLQILLKLNFKSLGLKYTSIQADPTCNRCYVSGIEFGFKEMPVGGVALDLTGVPMPEESLSAAKESDAVLLGAMGGYKWDDNEKPLKPETGLLQLREALKVFANLRPASVFPQLVDASTLKKEVVEGVDIMVIRELTGGIYFGKPRGFGTNENGDEIAFNTEIYATYEIDRIARVAFETARKRSGKLCSVDKANVLEAGMLWRKRIIAIASEYPDVELTHMYVDNAAMQIVRNPKQFDTIVTNNIFGDILSDATSMITGSIGMLPSASLSKEGPGIFEPIHGSAPDIAGKNKANPLATVLSAAMLLKYGLGEVKAAQRIETAVLDTLSRGFRTGDIYSPGNMLVGCKEMGKEVVKSIDPKVAVAV